MILVIHTEKAGHPQVRKKMLDFGRSLQGKIRPIAAVTTPLSIVYEGQDDFADSLKQLDKYFSIQYHGHFLSKASGARTKWAFEDELTLLNKIGFKPTVYAGGWWVMNTLIASLLDLHGFLFDTTMTDIGRTSFGERQYLPPQHGFTEIKTMRHLYNGIGETHCVSFHDFDLALGNPVAKATIDMKRRLALRSKAKSFEEL